jgi:tetratricopeptide (TPR) repeat protein
MKLQLKLALDKVKSGNFNMVEIYLQEVIPRVQKMWDKLGKTPKKRVIKTVDINALKEDMKKAADERKKAEDAEKKNKPAAEEEKVETKKMLKYDYVVQIKDNMNFNNGVSISSLQELVDVMPNITGPTLKHHVTKDKNEIADWVRDKFGDAVLEEKLRACKLTEEFVAVLTEDRAKNNKPFDPSKIGKVDAATVNGANTPKEPVKDSIPSSTPDSTFTPVTPQINPDTGEGESVAWNDIKAKLKTLNHDEQISLLEKSVKKYSQDMNIKFSLAMLYHNRKDYDKAEKMYKEILESYPKNTKALFYLGGLLKNQKRYDDALKYLNLYIEVKRTDPKVRDLIQKLEEKTKK